MGCEGGGEKEGEGEGENGNGEGGHGEHGEETADGVVCGGWRREEDGVKKPWIGEAGRRVEDGSNESEESQDRGMEP